MLLITLYLAVQIDNIFKKAVLHGKTLNDRYLTVQTSMILMYSLILGSSSKIIRLREEKSDTSEILKGKGSANGALIPVKGINNLGNTCFFNAVMQVRCKNNRIFKIVSL